MRRITSLITAFSLMIFGFNKANAQAGDYTFTASSGTFTSIVGTGETNQPLVQADTYITPSTPIGFTFNFEGIAYTDFKASSNGFLSFGTSTSSETTNNLDAVLSASRPLLAPLWDDLDGNATGGSTASFIVTGTAPNRVFTYEWLNYEWTWNSNDPVISFQVKLYETTDVIEFVYRQETGAINNGSASIGITGLTSFLSLDNTGTSPSFSNITETANLNAKPASGQIYTFTPPTCASPAALTATNITTTAVDLGWGSTAATWDIEYDITGFTPTGTPTVTGTNTNPHNLTGLTPNTSYDFYVRADCGVMDGVSTWAGPFNFSTLCNVFPVPFSENFSSTSTTQNCWTVINNNSDGDLWNMDNTSNPLAADEVATINTDGNSGANDDYLITPTLTLTGNEQLRFSYRVNSAFEPNDFEVLLSTTGVAVANFTNTIMALDTFSNITYMEQIIDLSAYTGNVNIAFHIPAGGLDGWILYIDSVEVEAIPSCLAPTALTATNIGITTADLGWMENGTANTWDIEYDITGFTPTGTPTVTGTNSNPHNLTGLTANTSYDFYVRADCGLMNGTSTWVGPFNFLTLCDIFPVPFSENFSSTSTTQNCWTVIDNNTDGDLWDLDNTLNPLAGDEAAVINTDFNGGSNDDYLITPTLTLTGNEQLRFSYRVNSATEPNDFEILLSTTGIAVANFTNTIMTLDTFSNTTYMEQIIDLSAYTGNVNIAFHIPAGGLDGWRLYIDSVEVEAIPSCLAPTFLTTTNIGITTADLGWMENGTANTWDIEYDTTGFIPTGTPTVTGTNTNPHNLTGLTASTSYDFYVRADCGAMDGTSVWVGPFNFSTLCDIFPVPFSENFSSTSTTQNCWTVIDNNTDGDLWDLNNTLNPLAGDEAAVINTDFNGGSNDDYLITPTLTLTGNEQLRFSHRVQTAGEPNDFEILLSTTGIAVANFTNTIMALDTFSNTTYMEQIIDLSAYTGNVNIAFHIPAGGLDGWRLYIDSVEVEERPIIGTDTRTECDSLMWIDGVTYTASNNMATFNIIAGASNGADSLVTLDLTINNSNTGTDTRTECNTYTWIDGVTYTANNNTATFNIVAGNTGGCDSLVTLDLTINNSTTGIDTRTECNAYTWIDGVTYTANNNTATFNMVAGATNGCDSLVTLDLTIDMVDLTVTNSSPTLTANQSGATYRWLDCDNNNAVIAGETNQTFTATINGNYAVEVTLNSCLDTSACENVISIGIDEVRKSVFNISPNPVKEILNISSTETINKVSIFNVNGQLIKVIDRPTTQLNVSNLSKGMYILESQTNNGVSQTRFIKE